MPTYSDRSPQANRVRLGRLLEKYNGRVLNGIRMTIDKSSGNPSRYRYFFIKLEDEPAIIVKDPCYRPPGWEDILRETQPPGWEAALEKERQPNNQDSALLSQDAAPLSQDAAPLSQDFVSSNESEPPCKSVRRNSQISINSPTELNNSAPPYAPVSLVSTPPLGKKFFNSTYKCKNAYSGEELFNSVAALTPNQLFLLTDLQPPFLALDIETQGRLGAQKRASGEALDPWRGEIRLVTLAEAGGKISMFDLREAEGGKLPDATLEALMSHTLIIRNAAFDLRWLGVKFGIWPREIFCTQTASRILTPLRSVSHKFGDVVDRHLGVKLPKDQGGSDWGAFSLSEEQLEYARNDARYLIQLAGVLSKGLVDKELGAVFALEMKLLPLVVRMEVFGIKFNSERAKALLDEIQRQADEMTREIQRDTGTGSFNPDSTPHCLEYFKAKGFNVLHKTRKGETKESAAEAVLCAIDDPLASKIIVARKLGSLASWIRSTLKHVRPDGKIHSEYNQTGTTTGRFTSSDPNMQQVPKRHPRYGQQIRALYEASAPDRCLIRADYGQFELRGAARIAPEPVMCQAFLNGTDLHVKIVAMALGIEPDAVTKEQRNALGKSSNFGFIYGRKAEGWRIGIRKETGIFLSLSQAKAFRSAFFRLYPGIAAWHRKSDAKAINPANNSTRTPFGRLLLAGRDDPWERFTMFTNYVVQGGTADVIKLAIVRIAALLPVDVHLVIMAHDELVYDCPSALAEEVKEIVRREMIAAFVQIMGSDVPCEVDIQVLKNWGGL
jgi:DNA polymerase I-like protein with 3'-5' exonuclease and polymerase domains